ncbi:hypothetical protein MNR01_06410 [Lysobacter sp. S4-A87]|uniref:hypothetical protein n=1 Tax=Lysobacter sp. S4-A87 TaxID=2925843 RepID=UPI001F53AC37|nr:hypothetical protein [Lysobacter sp. S4-A87]UNK50633.1 hypothetical protein MNR01_06410 [Lysobacter sp. S4-A87]
MIDRVSNYPSSTFASTALLFFGSGLAATLLVSARPLESLIGVAVAAVGLSIMLWRRRRRSLAVGLMRHGRQVDALVRRVQVSGMLQVNGRSPYRIEAQWMDPATGEMHTFKSWNLWYDPTVFIRQDHVVVYIDPQRSDRYYMDLSFLPGFDGA